MTRAHLGWAVGALLVAVTYYVLNSQQGSFVTVAGIDISPVNLGEIAAVCFLFTVAFTLRKRLGIGLFGRLDSWLWAHVYLGLLGVFFVYFHSRWRLSPTAFLPNAAMFLLLFTAVSGLVGRLLYVIVPKYLQRLPDYDPPDVLGQRIGVLEREAASFAAFKSANFRALFDALARRPLDFAPAAPGWGQLQQGRAALPPAEIADFDRAAELLTQRGELLMTLGKRQRYRRLLDLWWTVHVRLTETGLIFAALHIADAVLSGRVR